LVRAFRSDSVTAGRERIIGLEGQRPSAYSYIHDAALIAKGDDAPTRTGLDLDLSPWRRRRLNIIHRILDDLDELLLPCAVQLPIFDHVNDRGVLDHVWQVGASFTEPLIGPSQTEASRGSERE